MAGATHEIPLIPERGPEIDDGTQELELREIEGPSALGGSLRRFAFLTWTIAITEFKLRFYGSVLGYLWQLFRPLALFAVLYAVFSHITLKNGPVPHYPVVLLMNIVLFTYFAEGSSAVTAVVDREQLVRKIQVPRLAIPLAVTLTATFNVLLNLVVVLVFAMASSIEPRVGWLELPLLAICVALLAAGAAMLVSALYVRFRDVKPIWDVFIQIMFYATPVIYVYQNISLSPHVVKLLVMFNPMATILVQARHAVIQRSAPSAAQYVGGYPWLLVPIGIGVTVLVLGFWVFNREAPRIAEEL